MTDDFSLFANSGSSAADVPDDADIGLITAYLARELSPVQIVAVQDRLETDAAFREHVRPVIESWVMAASYRVGATRRAELLSRMRGTPRAHDTHPTSRRRSMTRIAAVVAIALLPLLGVAQVVRYAAEHPEAPGHAIAQIVVRPFRTPVVEAPSPGRGALPSAVSDAPPGSPLAGRIPSVSEQQPKPAHPLGTVIAKSSIALGSAAQLVSLSDGRVLVGDPTRGMVLLLDANLANPKTVLGSQNPLYFVDGVMVGAAGSRPAGPVGRGGGNTTDPNAPPKLRGGAQSFLVPFRGDSSLWFDAASETFQLIDPFGKLGRSVPPPPLINFTDYRNEEPPFFWGGGLVYKVLPIGMGSLATPNNRRPSAKEQWPIWRPPLRWNGPDTTFVVERDSLMVLRTRFDTPRADTVDMLAMGWINRARLATSGIAGRSGRLDVEQRPVPKRPDSSAVQARQATLGQARGQQGQQQATLLVDGIRVAGAEPPSLVQAQQSMEVMQQSTEVYEPLRFVDDVVATSDGYIVTLHARDYQLQWVAADGQRTAQKLSYPWRRITDDMRRVIEDSLRRVTRAGQQKAQLSQWAADSARLGRRPVNGTPPVIPPALPPGDDATRRVRQDATPVDPDGTWLRGMQFPEYFPPVPPHGALRADADGNVWIQQALAGNPTYSEWEVVSRTQGSIDHVRIPLTRAIAGFGKGGIVYLIAYDGGVARLEKVRVR